MGTSSWNLKIISDMWDRGVYRMPASIVDLGCAQLGQEPDQAVRDFAMHFCSRHVEIGRLNAFRLHSFMGDLYTMAGFEYVSLDIIDAPYVTRFDLNSDRVPINLKGRFDLVLNFGTSEHVLNQFNVFETMHNLAKVGGLIYSMFLINGFGTHGLIRYSVKFVDELAKANDYEILFRETHTRPFSKWKEDIGEAADIESFVKDECQWVVMQKTRDLPFCVPFDT